MCRSAAKRKHSGARRVWFANGRRDAGSRGLARVYGANTRAVDRAPVRTRAQQTADIGRRCNLSVLGYDVVGFLFLHSTTTRSKGCIGVFNDDGCAREHDLHDNPAVLDVL